LKETVKTKSKNELGGFCTVCGGTGRTPSGCQHCEHCGTETFIRPEQDVKTGSQFMPETLPNTEERIASETMERISQYLIATPDQRNAIRLHILSAIYEGQLATLRQTKKALQLNTDKL
jgi:hypothetical protein